MQSAFRIVNPEKALDRYFNELETALSTPAGATRIVKNKLLKLEAVVNHYSHSIPDSVQSRLKALKELSQQFSKISFLNETWEKIASKEASHEQLLDFMTYSINLIQVTGGLTTDISNFFKRQILPTLKTAYDTLPSVITQVESSTSAEPIRVAIKTTCDFVQAFHQLTTALGIQESQGASS